MYLHYTSVDDAHAIAASGTLELSRTITAAVYAVAVGGEAVPGVQHRCRPDASRDAAVLFDTNEAPCLRWPEEVIWHRDTALPLTEAVVLTAADADTLLDGSATPDEDTSLCPPDGCGPHRRSLGLPT